MSRCEKRFSRKSHATSRPSRCSVISQASWKRRGAGRAHAQTRGKIRQRNFGHGMVLQGKAYFEYRVVSGRRFLTESAAPVQRREWRWQMHQSLGVFPALQVIERRHESDRAARAEGQFRSNIPWSHASFVSCDWRQVFRRRDRRIRSIRRTRFGKPPSSALKNVTPVRRASSRVSSARVTQEFWRAIAEAFPAGSETLHIRVEPLRLVFQKSMRCLQRRRLPKGAFGRAPRRRKFAAPAAKVRMIP